MVGSSVARRSSEEVADAAGRRKRAVAIGSRQGRVKPAKGKFLKEIFNYPIIFVKFVGYNYLCHSK
jgi:hypothetical protein